MWRRRCSSDPWGRVDDGTVYVRTAYGEQVVGSWQAGSPDEALAYFERKYEGLVVRNIGLLERRVKTTDLSAKDAQVAIDHIREQVDAHHAVGDLQALKKRLDKLVENGSSGAVRSARSSVRSSPTRRGTPRRRWSSRRRSWRRATSGGRPVSGCAPGGHLEGAAAVDRKSDDELLHRFSHARSAFSKRRKAHFASLDAQREDARKTRSWSRRP